MAAGEGMAMRRAGATLLLALALAAPPCAQGQSRAEPLRDPDLILQRYPKEIARIDHGVRVRLKNGGVVDFVDNPVGDLAPAPCWYAPSLHVAGVCQTGPGVAVTILIDLDSGQRLSAPGLARLMPDPALLAIGPDPEGGVDADSVTLVRVEGHELVDLGGALFDADFGPGGWVDGDCYRLSDRGGKGAAWLERTAAGWRQAPAADSAVCQARHGR